MKFVKEHWILIAVVVGVYWIFFTVSGSSAISSLNTTLNTNPNGTPSNGGH
jgi:hypothetical protein